MVSGAYSLGLIGYPLGHSLSPHLHTAALQALDLAGEFRLYPVPPLPTGAAELEVHLARLRSNELQGLNVTIPHKRSILALLDELTPTAQAIGAVNTLYCWHGRLVGDNTDAAGFLGDLERAGLWLPTGPSSCPPGRALVLGAGGGARAVVYALAQAGWTVVVWARRPEQAQALVESISAALSPAACAAALDSPLSGAIDLAAMPVELQLEYRLIVNTTPVGMFPHVDASPWPVGLGLPQAAVYDLVYNPGITALVRAARAVGLPAESGLGMLVEQAALAFERWTGQSAPRPAMWAAVRQEHV